MIITAAIAVALDSGFWPRMMGLLAKLPESGVDKIKELALRAPISLMLGNEEAKTLLSLAHQASHTAARWLSGEEIIAAVVPYVPIPNVPGLVKFGEPLFTGESLYVFGGRIVKAGLTDHFTAGVESEVVPSVEDIVTALEQFAEEIGSDSPGLADFIQEGLIEDIEAGDSAENAAEIIPDWFVRRIRAS